MIIRLQLKLKKKMQNGYFTHMYDNIQNIHCTITYNIKKDVNVKKLIP